MKDGIIYTMKTVPDYHGKQITLGDVMETGQVEEQYFIPEEKLYYTDPTVTHSDEIEQRLPKEDRQTWQYLKGAKKLLRTSATGHEYVFSEGAISMIDQLYQANARACIQSRSGKCDRRIIFHLDEIAQFLLEKETITGEEFMEILNRTEE